MCRSLPCGAAFSACGKYIASGSEDKSVFVYDLRQITHAYRLNDHQMDIVTSVAFVPKNSQILTSSLNGIINLYGRKDKQ
ncbi:WD repeat-containing protein 27-like isoform X1 [Stegodyphus dumicola]|uniref:WD repeat-containing protein 27-like isoform X1 n=1 Tax=Stegodyphus dumicola TaxID=202533 RepID=UPI0015B0FAEA|nr:WD repeat-containing protein 27-like isoform X1 [Stegodyphus dumicola]